MNTKLCVIFVTLLSLAFANTLTKYDDNKPQLFSINDQIKKMIELLKDHMPCGIPELGVPVLAPMEKDFAEFQYQQKLAEIIVNMFDLNVDGLNNFEVNSVSLSVLTLKLKFDFTFKEIQAKSQYVANAILLKILRIKGNGDADITLKDLRIVGEAQIGSNSTTKDLYLRDFKATIVLGQFKSDITGLLWGKLTGKLANAAIEKAVPLLLKHRHDDVVDIVRGVVTEIVNAKLKGLTIKDLLDLINNFPELEECNPPAIKQYETYGLEELEKLVKAL
ncbi:uncharacterized protein LOC129609695 [Condylostylus longicornis]|uniref:uncharacterized protein LOC129609695 n=1 Tax=Condylostylus longicornis TaxID=2530218 RepID=UPI00244DA3AD|nr:uncharacterized protein LOC129609695 [Condylostylus longicornis]